MVEAEEGATPGAEGWSGQQIRLAQFRAWNCSSGKGGYPQAAALGMVQDEKRAAQVEEEESRNG
ncbi:hypothetical protein IMZ48_10990 [Candidatus Bathyarchaeota archaeon]|nr:hypothetical protein [Candidatus Bathyarchaeota archaeon]